MYVEKQIGKFYNKKDRRLKKDQFFYILNTSRKEKKIIEDTEATMALHSLCIAVGESLVLETQRGIEISYRLDTSDIREILKDKNVEHLFCDICMEGFCLSGISREFYDDVIKHLTETDNVEVVLYGNPDPVFYQGEWREIAPHLGEHDRLGAFCSYKMQEITLYGNKGKLLYFEGVMVYPDLQNLGYGCELMKQAIKKEKPDFVALRTQNPQMYSAFRKVVKQIYPNIKETPELFKKIGEDLARDLGMERYDKNIMRGISTYGRCMYSRIPAPVNGTEKLFSSINFSAGDCFICAGEPKMWEE